MGSAVPASPLASSVTLGGLQALCPPGSSSADGMSHTDLPGCHEHEMDTHMELFTWQLQEVVGVLLMACSRCVDTPRHRGNGHLHGRRRGLVC